MQKGKNAELLEAFASEQFRKRLERAQRFEHISGGGIIKKIQRLLDAPSIYIPYLLFTKTGLYHWQHTQVTLFWSRLITMPLSDYDALTLYMYGTLPGSELKLTKFFIKNLYPDDVFYDIGANRGFYTFLASELCKEVHAFEPMSALAEVIEENIHVNEHVTVNAVALSDINGSIDFYTTDSTMTSTISAAVAGHNITKKSRVRSATLDAYVAAHTKPTILKIDAEGAEDRILKGGVNFFSSHAPVIAMEIWGKDNDWNLSMSASERLWSMGYQSSRLDEEGNTHDATGDLSAIVPAQGTENFIFKK